MTPTSGPRILGVIGLLLFICSLLVLNAMAETEAPETKKPEKPAFTVNSYRFTWDIVQTRAVELYLYKTEQNTRIGISNDHTFSRIHFSPREAVEIGKVLEGAQEAFERLRLIEADSDERHTVAGHIITFSHSTDRGFFTVIYKDERFPSTSSMMALDLGASNLLHPHLVKAEEMAAFVDDIINI